MTKELIRLYMMGFLVIVLVMNVPEVSKIINDNYVKAQPKIQEVWELSYQNVSAAIVPLVGKISGKPQLLINGKLTNVDSSDDYSLTHGQSLTAEQIDAIFKQSNSPAEGTGHYWIQSGEKYNIDAAYMLAIFQKESNFATAQGWAGWKENGSHTYNIGNMICSGYPTCYNGFRDYSNFSDPWWAGIEANTQNLASYRDDRKITTFDDAIWIWAPPSENDTKGYIEGNHTLINAWRNTNKIIANDGGFLSFLLNGTKQPFGDAQSVSAPITQNTNDSFGLNVKAALDGNNKALRNIVIRDGEQWSFNETVGNPGALQLAYVAGVYGGGWCDLSCRYVQALKGLGLSVTHVDGSTALPKDGQIVFIQHGGIALNNCSVEDSPYIWSKGAEAGFSEGRQDLIVNNNTGKTIHLIVVDNSDGTATIAGKLE